MVYFNCLRLLVKCEADGYFVTNITERSTNMPNLADVRLHAWGPPILPILPKQGCYEGDESADFRPDAFRVEVYSRFREEGRVREEHEITPMVDRSADDDVDDIEDDSIMMVRVSGVPSSKWDPHRNPGTDVLKCR
jgi:hypothetical protein